MTKGRPFSGSSIYLWDAHSVGDFLQLREFVWGRLVIRGKPLSFVSTFFRILQKTTFLNILKYGQTVTEDRR